MGNSFVPGHMNSYLKNVTSIGKFTRRRLKEEVLSLNNISKMKQSSSFGSRGRIEQQAKKMHNPKGTLKKVYQYMQPQKWIIFFVTFLVVISSLLSLLGPYFIGVIIDDYILQQNVAGTVKMCLLLLTIYLFGSIFTWLHNSLMINVAIRTISQLRDDLYKKLQILSLKFFDRNKHGDLMSRFTNDLEHLNQAI